MTVTISKWRNSQGFRLPKNIMKDLHLAIEDLVSQISTECKLTEEFISIYGQSRVVDYIPQKGNINYKVRNVKFVTKVDDDDDDVIDNVLEILESVIF